MKNKFLREKQYQKIINKILIKTILAIALSITVVLILSSISSGKIGDIIIGLISKKYKVSMGVAYNTYWQDIRVYFDYILLFTIVMLIVIFFRLLLSWFTKYFDEIIIGINQLAKKEKNPIIMSDELTFMSEKLNDVREQLERSSELEREEEKRKNELIVYLAHDIKTPLTSIIGYLNLLNEKENIDEEEREKYTKITLNKAYRLEKLINEFFEITRYNLQAVPLNKENININYMVIQIVDELYPELIKSNKKIKINIDEEINLDVDSEKIARVFNNILKNAIAYSEKNSVIEIEGKSEEKEVKMNFKSKGIIPKEQLQYIFEKFYRVDNARQSSTGGAGLGLAIVKDIISLHSGTIKVQCESGYTIFNISLPKI
ncbi:MAG: sensor histidine kinase [Sarcina sp.]